MEESSNVSIRLFAGIIITLLVISLGFVIYRASKSGTGNAVNQINQLNDQLTESKYTDYDGQTLTGTQVISLIDSYAGDIISVEVKTLSNTTGVKYYYDGASSGGSGADEKWELTTNASGEPQKAAGDLKNAKKKASTDYISPNGSFECKVIRNKNNAITCVRFTQV